MKTRLFILFLVSSTFLFGQQPYKDAITLQKYWEKDINALNISKENSDIILSILYEYLSENTKLEIKGLQKKIGDLDMKIPTLTDNDAINDAKEEKEDLMKEVYLKVQAKFKDGTNPFIKLPPTLQSTETKELGLFPSQLIGSKEGINLSKAVDGIGKFLVDQVKKELTITFFERFNEILNDDENKDFQTLFPKTKDILEGINEEIYNISNFIDSLREAFDDDLRSMLENLEKLLKDKKDNTSSADVKKKIEYFYTALMLLNDIRSETHPADAIGQLAYQNYDKTKNKSLYDIQETVKLFNIFSSSLKSEDTDRYWIPKDELQKLANMKTFKMYLGLLYQLHGEQIIFEKKFSSYLDTVANSLDELKKYQKYVFELISDANRVSSAVRNLKKEIEEEKVKSFQDLFVATISLIRHMDRAKDLNATFTWDDTNKVIPVIEILNDIYVNITEKKYNLLVLDVSKLLEIIFESNEFKWQKNLLKYGTFMANAAKAENSDQVKAAIESIALPTGSSIIKKRTEKNVSLNAYVGISPGLEYNGDLGDYNFSLGVNAPIGIAFSKGLYKKESTGKFKEKGSSTWFLSLIDVGAVTNFRFGDSETEELPEIKFENIFAPGLYYVYGLPRAPISIGLGGQLGPQLRKVTATNIQLNSDPTFSFRVFVAVDIPLLNFYTKSR